MRLNAVKDEAIIYHNIDTFKFNQLDYIKISLLFFSGEAFRGELNIMFDSLSFLNMSIGVLVFALRMFSSYLSTNLTIDLLDLLVS